jgi:parvulin-like peptidyl-prolyl isomerase
LAADEVVATVNQEPVTGKELKVLAYTAVGGIDSTHSASFNTRLLDQMIDRKLMAQEAQAAGVSVPDSVVTNVLDQFVRQFGGEAQVDQMLAPMGLAREDFRLAIQRDLTIRKYVDEKITGSIAVSEGDVRAFYDGNPDMFAGTDSVHVRHIILLSHQEDTDQMKKDRRSQLLAIRQRAVGGEDFAALARQYSQDNVAQEGGDLGYFPRGMMVKPFEDAAFALKKNQVSDVVETQFGMHLIKCIDKKQARPVPFDTAKSSIEMMLKQRSLSTELQNRLQKSRDAAIIVRSYETGA